MKDLALIAAPIMGITVNEMVDQMAKAKDFGADVVHIQLDFLASFDPPSDVGFLIETSPLPTIFAYRPKWDGGCYEGDENKRLDVLRMAMELGADYVEVELQLAEEFNKSIIWRKPEKFRVIVSSYNHQITPEIEELGNLVAKIQSVGADIVKIVTTAIDVTDAARMFQVITNSQVPMIGLVQGEKGLMSRVLCSKFGGYLTYGTIEPGKASDPGKPTIKELLNLYNFRQVGPDTRVFGLVGKPVSQSKSPMLYNIAFKSVGFNGVYVPFLVDDVQGFFWTYTSPDFAGFSCTLPFKEAVLNCLDEVDPVAKSIGSVNCIIRREDDTKLVGYNTDCFGAITGIENGLRGANIKNGEISGSPLAGKLFVVIGAGGAGKSLAYGAKQKGARVIIANRTIERAGSLAEKVGGQAISLAELENFHPEDGMILANTTSIGMVPNIDNTPIPKHALKHYTIVFDAVYTPKMTRLLREAEQSGITIVTGVEMLIGQAYEQYERFTGLPAPKELFRKVLADY